MLSWTKGRRIALVLAALAAAGAAWFLVSFGRIAAGYAATITALQVFGSGDALETVRAERLALPFGLAAALSVSVEPGEHEVRASFLGAFERRACWRPGLGVTRVSGDTLLLPDSIVDLVPPLPDDEPWPLGESEELAPLPPGIRAALESALDGAFVDPASGLSRGTHAVAVVRDGRLVAERYRPCYDLETPILGWSMTKSVTATLFARLVALGRVGTVDERVLVPEWSAPDDPRAAITYDQLLRMTSGLAFFANYDLPWSDSLHMLFASPDAAAYAAAKELLHPPGTVWSYSDGTSNVLARCIRTLAADDEESRRLFPQRELFALLSMSTAAISVDAAGNWVGSSLMQASARDWARFGWLYASDGVVGGERILPPGWVDYATSATPTSPHHCYGAHFWRYDAATGRKEHGEPFPPILAGVSYACGHDGQYVWIDRARRIVLVRLGAPAPARFDAETFASEVLTALSGDALEPEPGPHEPARPGSNDEGLFELDHWHALREIETTFATLAERHPRYFRSGALGTSLLGRSIPLLEVTDLEAGGPKHGLWIDAAIHGHELASAEIVLGFAEELRRRIARGEPPGFLQRAELFLVPVLNVDARELCIVPPYPPLRGNLLPVDDDGDGTADEDGRTDLNGDGYASLQETADQDGDGGCGEDPPGGVDLNRDFPVGRLERAPGWRPQPETLAVMRFWEEHPNLALALSYHGGSVQTVVPSIFVWPPVPIAARDAPRFSELLRLYREHCGGEEWNPLRDPDQHGSVSPLIGTSMEWFYAERGALAFTLEVEAGLRDLWSAGPDESIVHDCMGLIRVPRSSVEARQRSIASLLPQLARRHASFLLALAERLPFE